MSSLAYMSALLSPGLSLALSMALFSVVYCSSVSSVFCCLCCGSVPCLSWFSFLHLTRLLSSHVQLAFCVFLSVRGRICRSMSVDSSMCVLFCLRCLSASMETLSVKVLCCRWGKVRACLFVMSISVVSTSAIFVCLCMFMALAGPYLSRICGLLSVWLCVVVCDFSFSICRFWSISLMSACVLFLGLLRASSACIRPKRFPCFSACF